MTYFMYSFTPILAFALLSGLITFKIYKRSISTSVIVVTYCIASTLFFFGYVGSAMLISTAAILILYARAITRAENDTWSTNKFIKERRRSIKRHWGML